MHIGAAPANAIDILLDAIGRVQRPAEIVGHLQRQPADNGPGLVVDDLPRLTCRFYRGERSRTTPGNSLGLRLVSAVAELHGATLALASGALGLRATLDFPGTSGRNSLTAGGDMMPWCKPGSEWA